MSGDGEPAFVCPITLEPVSGGSDVAITAVGQAYSPAAIRQWLDMGHDTDPVTGARLPSTRLIRFTFGGDMGVLEHELQRVRDSYFQVALRGPGTVALPTRPLERQYARSIARLSARLAARPTAARPSAAPPARSFATPSPLDPYVSVVFDGYLWGDAPFALVMAPDGGFYWPRGSLPNPSSLPFSRVEFIDPHLRWDEQFDS